MRKILYLAVSSVAVFVAAFMIRWLFFWDVMPISWDHDPPQSGALEMAFLLLSIQNTAAIVASIASIISCVLLTRRRRRAKRTSRGHWERIGQAG